MWQLQLQGALTCHVSHHLGALRGCPQKVPCTSCLSSKTNLNFLICVSARQPGTESVSMSIGPKHPLVNILTGILTERHVSYFLSFTDKKTATARMRSGVVAALDVLWLMPSGDNWGNCFEKLIKFQQTSVGTARANTGKTAPLGVSNGLFTVSFSQAEDRSRKESVYRLFPPRRSSLPTKSLTYRLLNAVFKDKEDDFLSVPLLLDVSQMLAGAFVYYWKDMYLRNEDIIHSTGLRK
ncbi:uncharacterized protein LOC135323428 [Dromaius novaehollandiae]|uniref:uncharacterized protein LOC135323428 n=1 Tax=Dromaius novaehollandiae TaxID=8790 RepID=UPI00311E9CE0